MAALHQLDIAGADGGAVGVLVQVEIGQGVAFDLADAPGVGGFRTGLGALTAAEQAERVAIALALAEAMRGRSGLA